MKNNDITYEYRVFTNRLIDVEHMEVGKCTRKVIDNLKSKDKVDGRFFHTSDSNEWFFCWNGELQELNLSGDASVNEALKEVKDLIDKADAAVGLANDAAAAAGKAAEDATSAVESIKGKADQDYVDSEIATVYSTATEAKATADAAISAVNGKADLDYVNGEIEKVYSTATEAKATAEEVKSNVDRLSALVEELPSSKDIVTTSVLNDYAKTSDLEDYAKSSDVIKSTDLESYLESYATKKFVGEEIKKEIPTNVSDLTNDVGYLTEHQSISHLASKDELPKKVSDLENDKEYITSEDLESKGYLTAQDISGKQDKIDKLDEIREGAAKGATALQSIPDEYVTETELDGLLSNSDIIKNINSQIAEINTLLGSAEQWTDTILKA